MKKLLLVFVEEEIAVKNGILLRDSECILWIVSSTEKFIYYIYIVVSILGKNWVYHEIKGYFEVAKYFKFTKLK